jgi:hypothetical protein
MDDHCVLCGRPYGLCECGPDPRGEEPPAADDLTVLGHCPHGVDLDREFCPEGCRI